MVHAVERPAVCRGHHRPGSVVETPLKQMSMELHKGSFGYAQDDNSLRMAAQSIGATGPRGERRHLVRVDVTLGPEHQTQAIEI